MPSRTIVDIWSPPPGRVGKLTSQFSKAKGPSGHEFSMGDVFDSGTQCFRRNLAARAGPDKGQESTCAVTRRRFPAGANPARRPLQPEATGAGMEATKCLKPPDSGHKLVTARVCRPQCE